MADHPWTCRERCFYCGMTRNKRQPLQLCTYLALCQTRLNDNIFTYQYFLITIKFYILEWRGNYKSHEIRIWKNEGKKLSRNLYRFHFRPNLCIYSTFLSKTKIIFEEQFGNIYKYCKTNLWQLVIEPAAGTGVAVLLSEKFASMDSNLRNVGVILCGGNVDINHLPWYNRACWYFGNSIHLHSF